MTATEQIFEGVLASGADDVDSWPLMDRPGLIVAIMGFYLLAVLKVGPALMKNRKPMGLANTIVFYNFLQIAFSMYLVYKCLKVDFPVLSLFSDKCPPTPMNGIENARNINIALWWYHVAKITELLDTVFFVLRKSDRQITFLHVYHHGIMVGFTWLYLKYGADYQGPVFSLLNSIVHVFMYFYYMVAAMGPKYKKFIWWKIYMTKIQMTQFITLALYVIIIKIKGCNTNTFGSYFLFANAAFFLTLFVDFYIKAYIKSSKAQKEAVKQQ